MCWILFPVLKTAASPEGSYPAGKSDYNGLLALTVWRWPRFAKERHRREKGFELHIWHFHTSSKVRHVTYGKHK